MDVIRTPVGGAVVTKNVVDKIAVVWVVDGIAGKFVSFEWSISLWIVFILSLWWGGWLNCIRYGYGIRKKTVMSHSALKNSNIFYFYFICLVWYSLTEESNIFYPVGFRCLCIVRWCQLNGTRQSLVGAVFTLSLRSSSISLILDTSTSKCRSTLDRGRLSLVYRSLASHLERIQTQSAVLI